jgi:hypothetical protein
MLFKNDIFNKFKPKKLFLKSQVNIFSSELNKKPEENSNELKPNWIGK